MKDAEGNPLISVNRLVKQLGRKTILNGINLQVFPAEFVAIIGPNGAGKTTLLRILSTLMLPNHGEVSIAGHQLPEEASTIRHLVGVVFHQPLLYGELTAEENLKFYARLFVLENAETRIRSVLQQVGLASRSSDLVRTFSRGMQQRLSIGRAILHEPTVLLLDEPFTGLDPDACDMFEAFLRQVAAGGCSVLMTSHDLAGVENLASRFDILSGGRIVNSIQKCDLPEGGLSSAYQNAIRSPFAGDPV
jgi:heme exporter protein A